MTTRPLFSTPFSSFSWPSFDSPSAESPRLRNEPYHSFYSVVALLPPSCAPRTPPRRITARWWRRYAHLTARQMHLSASAQQQVYYAGLLHDIGKIGVCDKVLHKRGPLLPDEWKQIQAHVQIGHELVGHIGEMWEVAQVVLHHHERFDGTGYPNGLKGTQIPIGARVVAVTDAYCAMIAARSYKPSYSDLRARAELQRQSGTQFDPVVVRAFLRVLEQSSQFFK